MRDAQQRLERFDGLHMTPLDRLHMTTLIAGSADELSEDQLQQMIKTASGLLAETPPITVVIGGILYHPEAIMLAVRSAQGLAAVRDAAQAATQAVTDRLLEASARSRWVPHITICYSTADQATGPIADALGTQQQEREIQVSAVSLVVQHGPERLWDWRIIGTVRLRPAAKRQP